MAKFYVLDLGVYGPSDWTSSKTEVEARSVEDAARDFVSSIDEACVDGQRWEVVVASEEDGSDAELIKGICRITVKFEVKKSEQYKVEPPEAE